MNIKYFFCSVLCLLIVAELPVKSRTGVQYFKSPKGLHLVKFRETKHVKSTGTDDMDDVSHVKYAVLIYRRADSLIAQTDYTDVYGWSKDAEPTAPEKIFGDLTWSPDEDFVIFPEEGWASAPGPPNLKVLNLNSQLQWSETNIYMSLTHWADDFRIFGNSDSDCYYCVVMFDGKTGKTHEVIEAKSPIGYQIVKVEGTKLLIEKVLDNCRTEKDEHSFTPECQELDINTLERRVVPCK